MSLEDQYSLESSESSSVNQQLLDTTTATTTTTSFIYESTTNYYDDYDPMLVNLLVNFYSIAFLQKVSIFLQGLRTAATLLVIILFFAIFICYKSYCLSRRDKKMANGTGASVLHPHRQQHSHRRQAAAHHRDNSNERTQSFSHSIHE